jgi:ATP synthase protein I
VKNGNHDRDFAREISRKEHRRLRGRRKRHKSLWFGFGYFGIVGWLVMIPTVLGLLLGIWLDRMFPGDISWTLTFLIVGLVIGCLNAWQWITREQHRIEKERNEE